MEGPTCPRVPGMLHARRIGSARRAEPGGWDPSARLDSCKGSEKQTGFLRVLGVKERLCCFDRNIYVELSEGFLHFIGLTS